MPINCQGYFRISKNHRHCSEPEQIKAGHSDEATMLTEPDLHCSGLMYEPRQFFFFSPGFCLTWVNSGLICFVLLTTIIPSGPNLSTTGLDLKCGACAGQLLPMHCIAPKTKSMNLVGQTSYQPVTKGVVRVRTYPRFYLCHPEGLMLTKLPSHDFSFQRAVSPSNFLLKTIALSLPRLDVSRDDGRVRSQGALCAMIAPCFT
ncbi:hypothetical protein BJ165DRAFT_1498716 [Panaeolus papilionaceus]|nr:hypothetical protein BJ165DRAFT_1498716 [Panaeolus papilionaceus]